MPEPAPIRPRNYFLNEAHQLPIEDKSGGGRTPHYFGVDWAQRSQRLVASLEKVERRAASSPDPLSRHRYYILADPVKRVVKESKAKDAKEGEKRRVWTTVGRNPKSSDMTLRAEPDGKPLSGSRERVPGYPLFRKTWTLEKCRDRFAAASDLWTIEFTYEQLADPSAGHQVPGAMRIAFAAELWDAAEEPLHPHQFVQALPISATFLRLSNTAAWLPQPITITTDL